MCCTFGDLTDVQWWRELQLPNRTIIGRDGRILRDVPEWITDDAGRATFGELSGKTTFTARELSVQALRDSGDLDGEPQPTQRVANFYEKGDKPLEIVSTRQWYIANGGRDADLRAALVARGDEITLGAVLHAVALHELDRGPQRRLAHLPPAVLRHPVPGLVPAGRRRRAGPRPPRSWPRSPRSRSTRPRRLRPGSTSRSAASRAASSPIPTSSTPGPRRRSARRSSAAGSATTTCSSAPTRWTCARRRTTSSAPGCSPPSCARTWSSAPLRGRTPPSPGSSSTPTARR